MQFSSHAGYPGWRGRAFEAAAIEECVVGLKAVGALAPCDGVLSGYLGKAEVGEAMLSAVAAVRAANSAAAYCCDPVIGDVGRGTLCRSGRRRIPAQARVACGDDRDPQRVRTVVRHRPARRRRRRRAARDRRLAATGPRVVLVTSLALDDTPADALDMIAAESGEAWRLGRRGCRSPSTAPAT